MAAVPPGTLPCLSGARGGIVVCPACSTENKPGAKFCRRCGETLAVVCASCGAPLDPDDRFCAECGHPAPLVAQATAPPTAAPVVREAPQSERRMVSVLFADLVGFTALSESRDSEEVRDLLTRYFDSCRQLITR